MAKSALVTGATGQDGSWLMELLLKKGYDPYGVAEVFAYWACVNYREAHGLVVSNGILFNHESERRGLEFLTRKVSTGVAKIHHGLAKTVTLGNLDAKRDWGYAPEFVDMMWRVLPDKEGAELVGGARAGPYVRRVGAEARPGARH